jgi:hypothetical protein
MTLEKEVVYDHTIGEDGDIQVRRITKVLEDGVEIARKDHRHVVHPGDNTTDEDERTKGFAKVAHTQKVIDKHLAKIEKGKLKTG